ncbi:MAG: hypothetical protein KME29_31735 [Calothrix sp. FI2-JRJ7]|nr:hypothetical protein [Calothrix sp. FI2-JRJ7]
MQAASKRNQPTSLSYVATTKNQKTLWKAACNTKQTEPPKQGKFLLGIPRNLMVALRVCFAETAAIQFWEYFEDWECVSQHQTVIT